MKYTEVFVPGGFPRYTYNPRDSRELEDRLKECTENLCKLVTVTGHTKSGKTVLARKVLPPEDSIWIDGGAVADLEDFWSVIIEALELFQGISDTSEESSKSIVSGKAKVGANLLVAKGEGEIGADLAQGRREGQTRSRLVSSQVAALRGLASTMTPVVIDDFHYLPKPLQGTVVRALKRLIFDGLPVVVIAIPHRRYDAVKVEREMTGRIRSIEIPEWESEELSHIPTAGFPLLDLALDSHSIDRLSAEALGSPHLMQEFCRAIGKRHSDMTGKIQLADDVLDELFREIAETIGRPIFEKLARGPRQRSDRVPRRLKNGEEVDIYQLVLHGLAYLKPGLVTLEYEELRTGIRDVIDGQLPQLHEVARVLKHMARIAATDQSSTPVIDFEDAEKKLHVTDPFFAYYLKWGELAAS